MFCVVFLAGIHDRDEEAAQQILDDALASRILRRIIVPLQTSVETGPRGIGRMMMALDFDDTPLEQFGRLVWHSPLDALSDDDVRYLLAKMLERPGGARVVLDGLAMRLHVLKQENLALAPELKRAGLSAAAALLRSESDLDDGGSTDHNLSEILKACMDEAQFPEGASAVFDAFFSKVEKIVWVRLHRNDGPNPG